MGKYIYTLGRESNLFFFGHRACGTLVPWPAIEHWPESELPDYQGIAQEKAILTKHKTQHTLCVWLKTYKQSRNASELWQNTFATDIIKFYTLFYFKYICISVYLSYLNTDKYFKYIYIHTKNLQISKKTTQELTSIPMGFFL